MKLGSCPRCSCIMPNSHAYPLQHDEEDHTRPTTPWVRSVISGVDLMRDARVGAHVWGPLWLRLAALCYL